MGVVPYWGRQPAAYLAGLCGVHCMSWVGELGPRVLGGWMRHVVRDLCQWPIFGYGGLYGVHCMSWVVGLDPRVLGDKCGMSFTASANGLSSVTSYGLRVLVSTSVTFLFWLCFDFAFGFGLGFGFGCVLYCGVVDRCLRSFMVHCTFLLDTSSALDMRELCCWKGD